MAEVGIVTETGDGANAPVVTPEPTQDAPAPTGTEAPAAASPAAPAAAGEPDLATRVEQLARENMGVKRALQATRAKLRDVTTTAAEPPRTEPKPETPRDDKGRFAPTDVLANLPKQDDSDGNPLVQLDGEWMSPAQARRFILMDQEREESRRDREGRKAQEEAAAHQAEVDEFERHWGTVLVETRKMVLPGLDGRKATLADKLMYELVAEAMETDPAFVAACRAGEEDAIGREQVRIIAAAADEVRSFTSTAAAMQAAKDVEAAALQPPPLGKSPAAQAPKAYQDMTPAEQREAFEKTDMTGGVLQFR